MRGRCTSASNCDSEPELADDWPEVVQAWFVSGAGDLALGAFDEFDGSVPLPPGSYLVRYATRPVAEPADGPDDEPVAEECRLQFWPAAGVDRIIRQTGESAAYWHREGTEAPWTAAELAEQVDALRSSQAELAVDDQGTGLDFGPFHQMLQSLGPAGKFVGYADPELVAHLRNADQGSLRAITCWAVEQSLTIARIRDLPGLDEALALRTGADLPPDVAAPESFEALLPPMPVSVEELKAGGDFRQAVDTRRAIAQLYQAVGPITMEATCSMLRSTSTFAGPDPDWVVTAVRHVFPHVVTPRKKSGVRFEF